MTADLYASLEGFLLMRDLPAVDPKKLSFDAVSDKLKKNAILQKSDLFDKNKLAPDNLRELFVKLVKEEVKTQSKLRRDGRPNRSPIKDASPTPQFDTVEEASKHLHLLPSLVERLYFQYQTAATQAIIRDEQRYQQLRDNIEKRTGRSGTTPAKEQERQPTSVSHGVPSIQTLLRHEEERVPLRESEGPSPATHTTNNKYRSELHATVNGAPPYARLSNAAEAQSLPGESVGPHQGTRIPPLRPTSGDNGASYLPPPHQPLPSYPAPNEVQTRRPSQPATALSPSPRPGQASLSPPERSSASPIILPPVSGMLRPQGTPAQTETYPDQLAAQYRPGPSRSPQQNHQTPSRTPSNRASHPPAYPPQTYPRYENQTYSTYPNYNHPYHPHAYHGAQYSNTSYQTPLSNHQQYANYYSGYYGTQGMHTPYGKQYPAYGDRQTPGTEPYGRPRPPPITPVPTSSSSTKWKDIDLKGAKAPGSPTRPQSREISPLSVRSSSPDETGRRSPRRKTRNQPKEDKDVSFKSSRSTPGRGGLASRRTRGGAAINTVTANRGRTRSHSATSHTEEHQHEVRHRPIKPDPSVPHDEDASAVSFTGDESTRRSDRRRRDILQDPERPSSPRTNAKRKRGNSTNRPLASPSLRSSSTALPAPPKAQLPHKPGYILVLRNLPRTSSALLNTITAHKYASLFAKPLTEREAPGYSSLIHRNQDLKSIKAAISSGSRTIAAAVEQIGPEKFAGNNILWVEETEDVVPPKAIVNSTQLEKELIRIFANAVMFNPDLDENRGLGPAFRTRARTLKEHRAGDEDAAKNGGGEEVEGVKFEIGVARPEAGAVVKDARDMFAAVEEALEDWRGVGSISEEEAKDAPVLGNVEGSVRKKGPKDLDEIHEGPTDGEEEAKEASEEPRPKRRRR